MSPSLTHLLWTDFSGEGDWELVQGPVLEITLYLSPVPLLPWKKSCEPLFNSVYTLCPLQREGSKYCNTANTT